MGLRTSFSVPTCSATLMVLLMFGWHTYAAPKPSLQLQQEILLAARRSYLDPKLIEAMIAVESNFSHTAVSEKGAVGLLQMMPSTADECEIHRRTHIKNHLMGAAECFRKLLNMFKGNLEFALAAYNAGPDAVKKYNGIPPYKETQQYVKKVLHHYRSKK